MNEKLKNAIDAYGQANLSRETGIPKSTVSLVRNGKRDFTKSQGKAVAEILNIPLVVALDLE